MSAPASFVAGSERLVNSIAGRLSLRAPQRESLEILARLDEALQPSKGTDLASALAVVQSEFPSVASFERDFPSLAFALATGVGKTRLMGAAIAYLVASGRSRRFLVLAPNLTVYEKLKADFTPNTPKYVFQGLSEFASNPPEVITGDDYESGRSLFRDLETGVHINIFNIAKIASDARSGRIYRLSEYIGSSYYDYLKSLDDLVLLMDESHRYRASVGARAINELKPILGLEFTATPKATGAGGQPFRNVVISYPLARAMRDGFVKEPAVVTRENFRKEDHSPAALERLKLEDGIRVHENTKVELETYAGQNGARLVRPFLLVIAQDIAHATEIEALVKSAEFFDGRYAEKVIRVDSKQSGELADDMVERLLAIENAHDDRAPEIVIHVNKLGEGWDVTNLYTIVPLRAFAADILTEQTLGRGLRLPYGKRVGHLAVDTLHVVAHDHFDKIIEQAKREGSVMREVVLGRDIPLGRRVAVTVEPVFVSSPGEATEPPRSAEEQNVAATAMAVVRQFEYLPRSSALSQPEVQSRVVAEVRKQLAPAQGALEGIGDSKVDVEEVVRQVTESFIAGTIDIPKIVLQPKGETTIRFGEFDLDGSAIHLQPIDDRLLIHGLSTDSRWTLEGGKARPTEPRLENYIVRGLVAKPAIDYGRHADLLYKLAGQVLARLRAYLPDEDAVLNVLAHHETQLVNFVHTQMRIHRVELPTDYEATVTRGFTTLRAATFDASESASGIDFRHPVDEKRDIRSMSFTGFRKCLYRMQKFDSDTERKLALSLETDGDVLKWFKPMPSQFSIFWKGGQYIPDFVVETEGAKYIIEPKRRDEIRDPEVTAKADAAKLWCLHATNHEEANGGKPWSYLLVPHDAIGAASTVAGLAASYRM